MNSYIVYNLELIYVILFTKIGFEAVNEFDRSLIILIFPCTISTKITVQVGNRRDINSENFDSKSMLVTFVISVFIVYDSLTLFD